MQVYFTGVCFDCTDVFSPPSKRQQVVEFSIILSEFLEGGEGCVRGALDPDRKLNLLGFTACAIFFFFVLVWPVTLGG